MKILLAEDDNDMRRFLVKALRSAGYKVACRSTTAPAPTTGCAKSPFRCS
jgi:two-component system cell cycle response regulator CpdR